MEETTDLFGIPVPSTNKVFLIFIVIHILIAFVALASGLFAMFTDKTTRQHRTRGKIYYWSMLSSFVTVVILSVMRWPHNIHLLSIGALAAGLTYTAQRLARLKPKNWTRLHTICMGMSYVLLLTGFYVDNGRNLPFWKIFPQWFFWTFPSVVGIPIIIRVLMTHPLTRKNNPVRKFDG